MQALQGYPVILVIFNKILRDNASTALYASYEVLDRRKAKGPVNFIQDSKLPLPTATFLVNIYSLHYKDSYGVRDLLYVKDNVVTACGRKNNGLCGRASPVTGGSYFTRAWGQLI